MMPNRPQRSVHLVGSIPVASTKEALTLLEEELGDRLAPTVPEPDGQWVRICRVVESLREHPQLELVRDGAWTDYSDLPTFRVRRGRRLQWIELGYLEAFERSQMEAKGFTIARGRASQIGIPSPASLAYVAFGRSPAKAARRVAPFRDATIREIAAIHTQADGEVVFQLDLAAELAMVTRLPLAGRELAAERLAAEVLRLVNAAPRGGRFGLHLCLGDLASNALVDPPTAGPAVLLANAIMASWPQARSLEYVHVGLAPAAKAPRLDPDYYAPLQTLWIPPEVRFIGGFVHEKRSRDELVMIRDELEHLLSRKIDVAAACGLGSRDLELARTNIQLALAVASAESVPREKP